MTQAPPHQTAEALTAAQGISHAFFGRAGGVSEGVYASLNTGYGSNDTIGAVYENRALCAAALGAPADNLITARQVHSPRAVIADGPWSRDDAPEADAIVTDRPGLAIGILAADCMPFLLADPEAGIIGAAHAGWRGALAGILEGCISAMQLIGAKPERIVAALGPCLRQPNFEVGMDVYEAFTARHSASARFFGPGASAQKRQLDLAGFGVWRLAECGVETVESVDACTLAHPDLYFSNRASKRAGEQDYGRNLSAIVLRA